MKKYIIAILIVLLLPIHSLAFEPLPIIEDTIEEMQALGFDDCEVIIKQRDKAHGYYNYEEDFISVYPKYILPASSIKYRHQCNSTYLHEYGHHIWFTVLTEEQKQQYIDSREWTYKGYFDNPIEMWAEEWKNITGTRYGIYTVRHNLHYMYSPVLDIIDNDERLKPIYNKED